MTDEQLLTLCMVFAPGVFVLCGATLLPVTDRLTYLRAALGLVGRRVAPR